MSITEFLLARIAEDEAAARAATPGPWEWWNLEGVDQGWSDNGPNLHRTSDEWKRCEYFCTWTDGDTDHRGEKGKPGHEHKATTEVIGSWGHDAWGISIEPADAEHIARHDPARVLAECAAKRSIVGMHQPMKDDGWVSGESHGYLWCSSCGSVDYDSPVPYPCPTLRALAAVYADHPEYQDEWKVEA